MTAASVLTHPMEGRRRAGQLAPRGPGRGDRTPGTSNRAPRPVAAGDVVLLDRRASVQFETPIYLRVIRHEPAGTADGWSWVEGYQIDPGGSGHATAKRLVLVRTRALLAPLRAA